MPQDDGKQHEDKFFVFSHEDKFFVANYMK